MKHSDPEKCDDMSFLDKHFLEAINSFFAGGDLCKLDSSFGKRICQHISSGIKNHKEVLPADDYSMCDVLFPAQSIKVLLGNNDDAKDILEEDCLNVVDSPKSASSVAQNFRTVTSLGKMM